MALVREAAADTYYISLDQHIAVLNSASRVHDDFPLIKPSKEDLIEIHKANVALLEKSSSEEPRLLILPAAYSPSITSLSNLQRVSILPVSFSIINN
jgi:hypothetical protein